MACIMSFDTSREPAQDDIEMLTRPRPRVRSGCLTCRKRRPSVTSSGLTVTTAPDSGGPVSMWCQISPGRGADYRGGPDDLIRKETTNIVAEGTVMPTTPSGGLSLQSPLSLALVGTETWTTPLAPAWIWHRRRFSVQDQSGAFGGNQRARTEFIS